MAIPWSSGAEIWRALLRPDIRGLLPLRNHLGAAHPSVAICDGGDGAEPVLSRHSRALGILDDGGGVRRGWAACTWLVSFYAWSFLKTGRRTLVIGGGLGATYGYLYFVLKSQDYALVAGTLALFAVLALVMFCTRRINWYQLEPGVAGSTPTERAP